MELAAGERGLGMAPAFANKQRAAAPSGVPRVVRRCSRNSQAGGGFYAPWIEC